MHYMCCINILDMSYNNDQMNSDYGHPTSRSSNLHSDVNDIYGTTTGTTGRIIDDPSHQNANLQAMNNPQSAPNQGLNFSGPMTDQRNVDQSSTIIGSTGIHDQIHDESMATGGGSYNQPTAGGGSFDQAHRGSVGSTDSYNQGKRGSVGSMGSNKGRHRSSVGSAYAAAGAFGAIGAPTQRLYEQDNVVRDLPGGGRRNTDPNITEHNATEADRVQAMNSGMPAAGNIESTHPFNTSEDTHGTTKKVHAKPTTGDKIRGNLEKLAGKIIRDPNKVLHGENVAKGRNL
ncbi:hypothetical protein K501DRAFT_275960 [Backusella circina FSU 941]|nr:hypothetical protein K501DRAFT_275960 [Backusella circina FSU 941]